MVPDGLSILILYFSGTGNTLYLAERIRQAVAGLSGTVHLASVDDFPARDAYRYDLLILGYPVYACDMPAFMVEYVKKLSLPSTRRVILFSTTGFYAGLASVKVRNRLIGKGFIPLGGECVKMPGSDGMVFLKKTSRYVKKIQATDFTRSKTIRDSVSRIMKRVWSASLSKEPEPPRLSKVGLFSYLADSLVRLVFRLLEDRLIRRFYADDRCTGCGLCERDCPAGNIVVSGTTVRFLDHCRLCMRCVNRCPEEAIQIGRASIGKFRWKGPVDRRDR